MIPEVEVSKKLSLFFHLISNQELFTLSKVFFLDRERFFVYYQGPIIVSKEGLRMHFTIISFDMMPLYAIMALSATPFNYF